MRLAFTGTRAGMTVPQMEVIEDLLRNRTEWKAHGNGLCLGADTQMFTLVLNLRPDMARKGFPSDIPTAQARHYYDQCHELDPIRPPLERNQVMVDWATGGGLLLATPKEKVEQLRSGTWATVRYARKADLPIIFVFPDGEARREP